MVKHTIEYDEQTLVILTGKVETGSVLKYTEPVDTIDITPYDNGSVSFQGYLNGTEQFSVHFIELHDAPSEIRNYI